MEKKNIDLLLEDICGDEGLFDIPWNTKEELGVLVFLYRKHVLSKDPEFQDVSSDMHEFLDALELKTVDIDKVLKKCRSVGILNSENRFRKGKNIDSNILWILFAKVLEGDLECGFKNEEYVFKTTDQGAKKIEKMLEL